MSFILMLASGTAPVEKSKTFLANETWPVPPTTAVLKSAVGKGAAGSPSLTYYDVTQEVSVVYDSPEYGQNNTSYSTDRIYEPATPTSGCLPPTYYPDDHATVQYCYSYTSGTSAATTGASATGFNKTFPGGFGGPAGLTTHLNVPVTPGEPYEIKVPTGGSITITYDE